MTPFIDGNSDVPPAQVVKRLGLPVVSKPRRSSGGRDIDLLVDTKAVAGAHRRGRIFEAYIDAPEFSVETFVGGGEILFQNITEYARKTFINIVPADVDERTIAAIHLLNRSVLEALNIHWGITHLELYLTAGGPLFGEIALRPPGGYIMELLKLAYEFDAWQAFVAMELDQPFAFPSRARRRTGSPAEIMRRRRSGDGRS